MKILSIVGARPNFIKVAPMHRAFGEAGLESKIVHTGQHYDTRMSDVFFEQLGMPQPDYYLGAGGGSHTQQTAQIMLALEQVFEAERPDLVMVVGDVNSTVAAALVAKKMPGVRLAHNEAGLRSGDRNMPEEINRLLTDSVSDLFFVTEKSGVDHLLREGAAAQTIHFVGNVMIDSLIEHRARAAALDLQALLTTALLPAANPTITALQKGQYALMTMHRPSNVDAPEGLQNILRLLEWSTRRLPVVFPIHPRTLNNFQRFGLFETLQNMPGLFLTQPLGYLEFLKLMDNAAFVLTDSGGIQEETTYLQVPCLTFRDSTERPVTVTLGTNELLADLDPDQAFIKITDILEGRGKKGMIPPLWDGQAARRIAGILSAL